MKHNFFQSAVSLSLSYFLIMQLTWTGMSGAPSDDWDEDGENQGNGTENAISEEVIQSNLLTQFRPKTVLPLNNLESLRILLNTSHQYTTLEELVEDLENWRAPAEMRTKYPYYLAGHDEDGRPVWIGELGRWDVRRVVEESLEGGEAAANFDKYMRQCYYRAIKSLQNKESPDDPEPDLVFIFDFDELPLSQVVHVPTLTFGMKLLRDFAPLLKKHTGAGFIVNANYVTERLLALIRPILGSVFEKIEVFGNNKSRWIPHLLRHIPKDQLPHWYGGAKDFEPVAVYG